MLRVHCQSNATIDDKGRVALPRPLRAALEEAGVARLVVTFSGQALWGFAPDDFHERVEAPLEKADLWDEDVQDWVSAVLAPAQDVELDNQGRIRIPPLLRELAGLDKEVTINSVQRRLEIWDREAWAAHFKRVLANRPKRVRGLPSRARDVIPMPERG
jgi:MraZ protein